MSTRRHRNKQQQVSSFCSSRSAQNHRHRDVDCDSFGKIGKHHHHSSSLLKVIHHQTIESVLQKERQYRAQHALGQQQQQSEQQRKRPFALRTQLLQNLLRERQSYEVYQRNERRRRDGFLPSRQQREEVVVTALAEPLVMHPPGWLLMDEQQQQRKHQQVHHPYGKGKEGGKSITTSSSSSPTSLHSLALHVLAQYLDEYLTAMGPVELRSALSLLPPECIQELSILKSSSSPMSSSMSSSLSITGGGGVTDVSAFVLGCQQHVERLCLRAAKPPSEELLEQQQELQQQHQQQGNPTSLSNLSSCTLTDQGLLALLSSTAAVRNIAGTDDHHHNNNNNNNNDVANPNNHRQQCLVVDDWEEIVDGDSDNDEQIDRYLSKSLQQQSTSTPDGINIKLRRLELLDCQHLSAPVVLRLLERCSGITHLSLAGSFARNPQDGMELLPALPQVLPHLQVLDVTRCPWVVAPSSMISNMLDDYASSDRTLQHQQQHRLGEGGDLPGPSHRIVLPKVLLNQSSSSLSLDVDNFALCCNDATGSGHGW